jgi:hypothetical protein
MTGARDRAAERVPKLCGADVELGNFVLGAASHDTAREASHALLREIRGVPHLGASGRGASTRWGGAAGAWGSSHRATAPNGRSRYDPQDWGRKFLVANGGCAYIDLDHLEICLPEVLSAHDHVAAWHAMLRIARAAQAAANASLPAGRSIEVLVNNSDGDSHSYGSHLNFLLARRAWENVFNRRLHYLLYLATFQVSSIAITGQGKVGAENGAPDVAFQLAQRADFFETLVGQQTTYHRPIVNARDEALCGGSVRPTFGRLHCIFFDSTLCHVASLLKVGMMQIVLAMIEAERVDPRLMLEDPVDAVVRWSHDPALKTACPMVSGRRLTILELQQAFLEQARRFADDGGCEGVVPRAAEILALWEDTLGKLVTGDLEALATRLDWVLKRQTIEQVLQRHPRLGWESPEIKHIDHLYGSLDPAQGLYWAYESSGVAELVASADRVERFVQRPPEDTRAWGRTALLRLAHPGEICAVDWDAVTFAIEGDGYRPRRRRVVLADPLGHTKREMETRCRGAATLEEVLAALGAEDVAASPQPDHWVSGWLLGSS